MMFSISFESVILIVFMYLFFVAKLQVCGEKTRRLSCNHGENSKHCFSRALRFAVSGLFSIVEQMWLLISFFCRFYTLIKYMGLGNSFFKSRLHFLLVCFACI